MSTKRILKTVLLLIFGSTLLGQSMYLALRRSNSDLKSYLNENPEILIFDYNATYVGYSINEMDYSSDIESSLSGESVIVHCNTDAAFQDLVNTIKSSLTLYETVSQDVVHYGTGFGTRLETVFLIDYSRKIVKRIYAIDKARSPMYDAKYSSVYYCAGRYSYAFHSYQYCRGLANCSTQIYKTSARDAISNELKYCKICYGPIFRYR